MKKDLHLTTNPQISVEEAWNLQDHIVIDVRSPKEFQESTFPEAINLPLLEDQERETVGILYKHFGQKTAVEKGYGFLQEKMAEFEKATKVIPDAKNLTVFCARGGMRSQVVTALLRYMGHNAKQLTGGYKVFRNFTIDRLNTYRFQKPIVLHGKTGVGKTLVLNGLENVLDLEGLAEHRGSLFGGVGKNPVSQKTFETKLLKALEALNPERPVFIEGESRKVGNASIPDAIFRQMRSATNFLLEASIETRVSRTVKEYITDQPGLEPEIRSIIQQLKSDLGGKQLDQLLELFDSKDYASCFKAILLNYYDKKYTHSMKKLSFYATISTDEIEIACKEITNHAKAL